MIIVENVCDKLRDIFEYLIEWYSELSILAKIAVALCILLTIVNVWGILYANARTRELNEIVCLVMRSSRQQRFMLR